MIDRPGRGRPDTPADRASGQPARHAEPARVPPGRHDGDGGVLGTGDPPRRRPQPAGAEPPAATGMAYRHRGEPQRPRRLCAGGKRRRAPGDTDLHRIGGADRDGGARGAGCRRHRGGRRFLPCWELFAAQDASYRAQVLGGAPRIGIEAADDFGWERWLGPDGVFIGMPGFGASGKYQDLYKHFGITPRRSSGRCASGWAEPRLGTLSQGSVVVCSARPNRWLASWDYEMIGRTEVVAGDVGWPRAEPLLAAVWSSEVVATLPSKDVVLAHADWRVLIFDRAGRIIGHVGIFLRDATWDNRAVKVGGIGGVATREDCRRHGVASAAMRLAAEDMQGVHGVDFALLFCEKRPAPVYEKPGWRKFEGDVFAMQPQGRIRFDVAESYVLDMNFEPRGGVIDLCGLPW